MHNRPLVKPISKQQAQRLATESLTLMRGGNEHTELRHAIDPVDLSQVDKSNEPVLRMLNAEINPLGKAETVCCSVVTTGVDVK